MSSLLLSRLLLLLLVAAQEAATVSSRVDSWAQQRADLRRSIFGGADLPARSHPDEVTDVVNCSAANGGSGAGTGSGGCSSSGGVPTSAGVRRVVWNISHGYFPMSSTVYHVPVKKGEQTDSIMLHHHGHSVGCMNWSSSAWPEHVRYWGAWGCPKHKFWDYYNVSSFIHERLGMDYFMLYMPFLGVNRQSGPDCVGPPGHCNPQLPHCVKDNTTSCHNWLRQWQAKGDHTIGYFVEPVHLTINYALNVLGYKRVYMMGLSGGGWTTTLAAAVDPRIETSFPIAGSTPLSITGPTYWDTIGDYEQRPQPTDPRWYLSAANYTAMYLLAALEPGRASLQILHENDNCCFRGAGIHAEIMRYDSAISAALSLAAAGQASSHGHGVFSTAVVDWPIHMVSPRGKDVIEAALSRSIVAATTGALVNLTGLPCDMLRGGGVACHEGPVPPHYIPPPRPPAPPPPPNTMACEHKISEGDCLAGCCSWDSAKHRCDEAPPFNRVHRGGCYEGAKPPCVYVQATCEKTPSSSQRWRFVPILLPPAESEQWQHSLVQIVHMADDMCLSQACASGHNCSRILQHNQFDLAQCDAAESRQRFLLQNSSDSAAVILTSSIDEAFRVNVGEVSASQKPLQLWRPCTNGDEPYEKGIGFSNEIFRLDSEGGLRVKFGTQSFDDCVDVCHAGSMACGDKPPVKTDDGGGDLQRGIQFLGKGMEGAFAYDDPRALQSLKNLASTGADHIALTFSWYLNGTTSRTNHTSDTDEGWRFSTGPIRPIDGPAPSGLNFANCSTPTDHELITVITEAHALNLSVKLRPVVQADFPFTKIPGCTLATGGMGCPSQTGVGAGMSAAEFQVFFWGSNGTVTHPSEGSYAHFIYHIATLAERTKTEIISVSVEMSSANSQEAHFRKLIGGVRKIFSGSLHCDVASAPLSSTRAITDVKFWDLLDAVGVDAYPALTDGIPANETNPTVEQLVAAFEPVLKLMSDFYHGRVPPPPLPPGPQAPPCAVGGNLTNYSNFYPHHLAGPSGPNTAYVQYLGKASSIDDCLALCHRRSNCTSWSWHPKDSSTSSQHCFARSDGKWTPTYSPGDVCGKVKESCAPHCPPEPTEPNWYPAQNNTPIIWAENGLISTFNSFRHPGGAYDSVHPYPVCTECQARYYEAFFKAVWCNPEAREWFRGVYWWKWSTDPSPWSDDGAPGNDKAPGNNSDFEPQHKPAQGILTKFYRGGCPKTLL